MNKRCALREFYKSLILGMGPTMCCRTITSPWSLFVHIYGFYRKLIFEDLDMSTSYVLIYRGKFSKYYGV